jgi:hypothetical protein
MKTIYWVGEHASLKSKLPIGTPLVLTGSADPYRILAPLEMFFKVAVEGVDTEYGFSYFDLLRDDPLSREVRGPWVHDLKVHVTCDKLPGGEPWRITSRPIPKTIYATTHVCVNLDEYTAETDWPNVVKDIGAHMRNGIGDNITVLGEHVIVPNDNAVADLLGITR